MIVGEAKLRLDERQKSKKPGVFEELEEKIQAVLAEFGPAEIVKVLSTHSASKGFRDHAQEKGHHRDAEFRMGRLVSRASAASKTSREQACRSGIGCLTRLWRGVSFSFFVAPCRNQRT